MKYILANLAVVFCLYLNTVSGQTTAVKTNNYDQHKVFTPLFYPQVSSPYRTAAGIPGPGYWQNRVNYKIDANLDTVQHRITGTVLINYTNNSPDKLVSLWLQLDQNILKSGSRSNLTRPVDGDRFRSNKSTNGDEILGIGTIEGGLYRKSEYLVNDTRLEVRLHDTLAGLGGKIQIKIQYAFNIPEYGTDRMGRFKSAKGWIYEIAQWYPRMEVYDDISGWNSLPYLGTGEFYLEYGDFDYKITAPSDLLIVGSGELRNPAEVLSKPELTRLSLAQLSDTAILIRDSSDVNNRATPVKTQTLTWHFYCENARDVVWAASKAFLWDAARINLPSGKNALAQSVYPLESDGKEAWGRSTEYLKKAIELYSKQWFEFTYPVATNVAGGVSGMEYPGMIFCNAQIRGSDLWFDTNHEIGHNIFPMVVGSNERKYPWMDEGFDSFINEINTKMFNKGEYYRKEDAQEAASNYFGDHAETSMNFPDVLQLYDLGPAAYNRPAFGLKILREEILGPERFDSAFRDYINSWAFKHPTPWDFFHTMDNASGEDLSWFWNEWFFTTWKVDQAIQSIIYVDGDPTRGAMITIVNKEGMALPATILVREANGKENIIKLPAEIWQRGGEWTFRYESTSKVEYAQIDPEHVLPDINIANNIYCDMNVPSGLTASQIVEDYFKAIGGKAKVAQLNGFKISSTAEVNNRDESLTLTRMKGGRSYMGTVFFSNGNQLDVANLSVHGEKIQLTRRGKVVPIKPSAKTQIRTTFTIFPELDYDQKGYKLVLSPKVNTLNGHLAYLVYVTTPANLHIKNFYDCKTGQKLCSAYDFRGGNISTFSNYKQTTIGVELPFLTKILTMNQEVNLRIKNVEMLTNVASN